MEQENKTIAEKVINKIDQEHLEPISKWHFVLKDSGFWTLWGASVLLGACAIAGVIFSFSRFAWQYRYITHDSSLGFLLDAFPVFWLISFVGLIAFGYYNLRHTSRGYKFSFILILLVSLFLSFVFGTLLFAIGFGKKLDNLKKPLPFAPPVIVIEEKIWSNDQKGLLAGYIKLIDKENNKIVLILPSNIEKIISIKEIPQELLVGFAEGDRVKIIGFVKEDIFEACTIFPWEKSSKMMPPPSFVDERNFENNRNNLCKDVRPYQQYQKIFITN